MIEAACNNPNALEPSTPLSPGASFLPSPPFPPAPTIAPEVPTLTNNSVAKSNRPVVSATFL